MKKSESRREFLQKFLNQKEQIQDTSHQPVSGASGDQKIRMLTPDGKLVEVSGPIETNGKRRRTSNAELLNWINNSEKTKESK